MMAHTCRRMQKNKILKYVKILAARKNQAVWEIPAFTENQADWEILAFAKNQADWEILAFAKKQAGWEILAFAKKQADWEILALAKKQADDRILAGVEIPTPGEKPASEGKPVELEQQAACLLFRLGGISSCWLLPGLADEHVQILVDVMSLACSLQVRRRLFVPARHAKKWPKSTQQPKVRRPLGILLIYVKSQNS